MPNFKRGQVVANGLTFEYLEAGEGPLALCFHGFPDTPYTYRYLLPELADAGFHAVAPFIRGYAPTELPALRQHVHASVMVQDQIALQQALGGDENTVLIAHDWNATAAWGALVHAPDAWKRAVIMNIPPLDIFTENMTHYDQIKRSFYYWYFQMVGVSEDRVAQDELEFIKGLWGDWSPGYDNDEDMTYIREALGDRKHLRAAMGYYWGNFDPVRFGTPAWVAEQEAAWGGRASQPVLYLHGTTDGCHAVTQEQVERIAGYGGNGSESELIDGVGHFMLVEKPKEINERIIRFLTKE